MRANPLFMQEYCIHYFKIRFNCNIFGNKLCRCSEGSLYFVFVRQLNLPWRTGARKLELNPQQVLNQSKTVVLVFVSFCGTLWLLAAGFCSSFFLFVVLSLWRFQQNPKHVFLEVLNTIVLHNFWLFLISWAVPIKLSSLRILSLCQDWYKKGWL